MLPRAVQRPARPICPSRPMSRLSRPRGVRPVPFLYQDITIARTSDSRPTKNTRTLTIRLDVSAFSGSPRSRPRAATETDGVRPACGRTLARSARASSARAEVKCSWLVAGHRPSLASSLWSSVRSEPSPARITAGGARAARAARVVMGGSRRHSRAGTSRARLPARRDPTAIATATPPRRACLPARLPRPHRAATRLRPRRYRRYCDPAAPRPPTARRDPTAPRPHRAAPARPPRRPHCAAPRPPDATATPPR